MGRITGDLTRLAAEMATGKNMPLMDYDDWDWPRGMQITSWRKVFEASDKANEQARNWSVRLRKIIDSMHNSHHTNEKGIT